MPEVMIYFNIFMTMNIYANKLNTISIISVSSLYMLNVYLVVNYRTDVISKFTCNKATSSTSLRKTNSTNSV